MFPILNEAASPIPARLRGAGNRFLVYKAPGQLWATFRFQPKADLISVVQRLSAVVEEPF